MSTGAIASNIKYFFFPLKGNQYSPRFLESRLAFYVVVFLLVIKILGLVFSLPIARNAFLADVTGTDLFSILNQSRQSQGLAPLTESKTLDQAALMKAQDMVANNYFSHQSPQGITPWFWFTKAGYQYTYAGENLAVGFIDSRTVFNAWLNSPSHKENMLNPHYTEVGTAVVKGFGGNDAIVVVQLFGSPRVATQQANSSAQAKKISASTTNSTVTPQPKPTPSSAHPQQQKPIEVLSQQTQSAIIKEGNGGALAMQESPFKTTIIDLYNNPYLQLFSYAMLALVVAAVLSHLIAHRGVAHERIMARAFIFIIVLTLSLALNEQILNHFLMISM